jgi:hypothetical protein
MTNSKTAVSSRASASLRLRSGVTCPDLVSAQDQRFDPPPPILEGINLGAINQRLEAARLERRFDPIREGHILARIGDENPGFRPNVRRRFRNHSRRPQSAASRRGMLPNFGWA